MNELWGRSYPIIAREDERASLIALELGLRSANRTVPLLIASDGVTIHLPETVRQLLTRFTRHLIAGEAIDIISFPLVLTAKQAAEFLQEPEDQIREHVQLGTLTKASESPITVNLNELVAYQKHLDQQPASY